MVCWFHPIFNVFRFHVKMLFFSTKIRREYLPEFSKKSHTANRGFFQSIYISCEVRRRQSVIHNLYEVDTLLQKQTHITLSNLSLSKATIRQPLGPDFLCEVSKRASMETNNLFTQCNAGFMITKGTGQLSKLTL